MLPRGLSAVQGLKLCTKGLRPSLIPVYRQGRTASTSTLTFFTAARPPRRHRWWLLLPSGALLAAISQLNDAPASPVPTLLASPGLIPTSTHSSPVFEEDQTILSLNEPHRSLLERIVEELRWHVIEPLMTGARFIHLLIYFIPVFMTAPVILLGRPDPKQDFERPGAIWWYELVTSQMQRAGPTFIKVSSLLAPHLDNRRLPSLCLKLAQWAASRVDIFPQQLCDRLGKLHSTTQPHSLAYTKRVIERAFQRPFSEVFEVFEETPIGSGAIAQVS